MDFKQECFYSKQLPKAEEMLQTTISGQFLEGPSTELQFKDVIQCVVLFLPAGLQHDHRQETRRHLPGEVCYRVHNEHNEQLL